MEGKRVLIIGIGNSAVDVAVNCASQGRWGYIHEGLILTWTGEYNGTYVHEEARLSGQIQTFL